MRAFEHEVGVAVDALGPARLRLLADGVAGGLSDIALSAAVPVAGYAETARAVRATQRSTGISDAEAVAYLRGVAAGYERRSAAEQVETVWSGPASHVVPVRSTAQALVELCASACSELLLMTYSARPHQPVVDALKAARERGVRVSVVVETLQGAGGAIAGAEPAAAFLAVPGIELWHWPPGARAAGARMHAKIAVADGRLLLVSSANLTESGVARNIEAGILVRGGAAPRRAAEHVAALVAGEVLTRLRVGIGG